jgi:hypothetical protein
VFPESAEGQGLGEQFLAAQLFQAVFFANGYNRCSALL